MSKTVNQFYVPTLKKAGAWVENRVDSKGGKDWRGYRSLAGIELVAGHHTVTHPTGNAKNEVEYVRKIHMNNRGWGGIGYNFLITSETTKDGQFAIVYMNGDIGSIRAHTPNTKGYKGLRKNYGNLYLIGVSMVGMNHQKPPTDAQYRSYHELLKELIYGENKRMPKLKDWNSWQPHYAFDATACYGKYLDRKKVITPPPFNKPPTDPCKECKDELEKVKVEAKTWQEEALALTDILEDMESQLNKCNGKIPALKSEINTLKNDLETCQKQSKDCEASSNFITNFIKKILEWLSRK